MSCIVHRGCRRAKIRYVGRARVKRASQVEQRTVGVAKRPDRPVLEEIYVLLLSPTEFIVITFVRKL